MTTSICNRLTLIATMAVVVSATSARGGYNLPEFFVANPRTNSADWTSAVASVGGLANTDVNFQTMSTGLLDPTYYNRGAHDVGVTLLASDGTIDQILHGPGPDQGSIVGPRSAGEGTAAVGNYLESDSPGLGSGSSLSMLFAHPVMAVGLFTIDYYGVDPTTNTLTLSVYDTAGSLLGSATAARLNFQPDGLYFMGYVDAKAEIGRAVFTRGPDADGDKIGIGGIVFADGSGGVNAIPEPSSVALLAAGAAGFAARRRHRRLCA